MKTAYRLVILTILSPIALLAQNQTWFISPIDTIIAGIDMHDREAYDSAIAMFDQIHPGDTLYELAQYEKSLSLFHAERYEEAIRLARKGMKSDNRYKVEYFVNLGNALDELDRAEEAQAVYDSGIALFPGSNALYYNRAVMHLKKDRDQEAVADLYKAIELNPFHATSHYQLANLCLQNGNNTQALMALGYFFLIEPASARANGVLGMFNNALSEKTDLDPINFDFDPDKTYARSDRLISSYAALRDGYDNETDANFPLMKQMHLALRQIEKLKGKKDFFAMYYLPYYQAMLAEDYFESFSYLLSASIETPYYQNLLAKHLSDIKDLISWNSEFLTKHHEEHLLGYQDGAPTVKYILHEGSSGLAGKQLLDENGQLTDNYEFYHKGGAISAYGKLNADNLYEGKVISYHSNGEVSKEANYVNGDLKGEFKEYNERSVLILQANYEANLLDGPAMVYYSHGAKMRSFTFEDGVPIDTVYNFYANGQMESKIPKQNGVDQGQGIFYHENGALMSKITFKNDERNGPAEFYYPNGQLKVATTYNEEGYYNGHYKYYHSNGQLQEEGDYIAGIKSGNWKTFDATGTLVSEVNFDEGGKKTGTETFYDHKGRKTVMYQYKKEELVYYENYDDKGNIQLSAKAKRGKTDYKELSLDGTLLREGLFDVTLRVGLWKQYDTYGLKLSETEYSEEGRTINESKTFFPHNGEVSYWTTYKNDTMHGPFGSNFANGKTEYKGIIINDKRSGLYEGYWSNGQLREDRYYVGGDLNGPRKFYDPEGNLSMIEYYDMGVVYRIETYHDGKMVQFYDSPNLLEPIKAYYPSGKLAYSINRTGMHNQGKATWYYGNGQIETEGNFVDGLQDGVWSYYYPNGQLSRIMHYELGKLVGENKAYSREGQLTQIYSYLEGEMHGPKLDYSDEGVLTDSTNFWYGAMDGERHFFNEAGDLQHVRVYDNGKIIGWRNLNSDGSLSEIIAIENGTAQIKGLYPNGNTALEYQIDHGEFTGQYNSFYADGSKEMELNYKETNYIGEQRYYFPNGAPMNIVYYEEGVLNGMETYYYPNGKVKMEVSWKAGIKHGPEKHYDENGNLLAQYRYVNGDIYE